MSDVDSFNCRSTLTVNGQKFTIFRLSALEQAQDLPYSLKILLENLLRTEDGITTTADHIRAISNWDPQAYPDQEIQFTPARVVMQDFTGVPCIVDLATMREAMTDLGGDPTKINPLSPSELVIDHSVIADTFGHAESFSRNVELEYGRNRERYQFLRWGQKAFDHFTVVPPGTGIVHQVNVEHLATVVATRTDGTQSLAFPDTCVGTDSHTTMINGLGVLGWGVGGIEAEAAMLGQPVSMLIPPVVGFKLTGQCQPTVTATDIVLTITQLLREQKVVGKFVEFYGEGINYLSVANRATIANMSPEYGATCAIFPIDQQTINYLELTGRDPDHMDLVTAYAKEQGLWHDQDRPARYSEYVELDLSTVEPSLAGPSRPQDRISLSQAQSSFARTIADHTSNVQHRSDVTINNNSYSLRHGTVAIAAITSCTNTSNPEVMIAAGLLAQKAVAAGLRSKNWVKTTLAPGSQAVTGYLDRAELTPALNELGFNLVGYGCTTCIGNSGPISPELSTAVATDQLVVASVLSGNRNFEGRINPDVKLNYLASPPLVIAYALAGTMDIDFQTSPLGIDKLGNPVFLSDIWPTMEEITDMVNRVVTRDIFTSSYSHVFAGDERWNDLVVPEGTVFNWDTDSTYIRKPPYFASMSREPEPVNDIIDARVLALLGDSVTTDHISPAGTIKVDSPAGKYLQEHGVLPREFNSYGSRRGNHEVMIRGTFANTRLKNQLVPGIEGGFTRYFPAQEITTIYDAAQHYHNDGTPLVIIAGSEYGTGSSRDWAAKGTRLLGVRAVIAESFERIHRSNLIGMGVLPLEFLPGDTATGLGLSGSEKYAIYTHKLNEPGSMVKELTVTATSTSGAQITFATRVRIDTPNEAEYYRHGGILHYVLRSLI